MYEKRWAAVPPQLFTFNGTNTGAITVIDSSLFKVKQQVDISSSTLPNLNLEIKSIPNDVTILVGPIGAKLFTYTDVSAYLVADIAAISANEQKRSSVPVEEINRAVYEEEPVVALRTFPVDKNGDRYSDLNPFPVINIGGGGGGYELPYTDDIKVIRDVEDDPIKYEFYLGLVLKYYIVLTYNSNKSAIEYKTTVI